MEQGARCMDCGVPFCHGETGCPVDNLIPEWNDLVYTGRWRNAVDRLHSTNNFPEFTGRLCPAPCESACVLGLIEPPVSIKTLERTIIGIGFDEGWVEPLPPKHLNGKTVAVVGSGPAGLSCAQQLQRFGYSVTVYEKNDKPGGLLRYGIPDFKMEKWVIDRRIKQMKQEGVEFKMGVHVGVDVTGAALLESFDLVVLAGGCEEPRDLKVPGRDLKNIHFAMELLVPQNRVNAGLSAEDYIFVKDGKVLVIGGGDTGSDCVGTANRQGAASVVQVEILPVPPKERSPSTPWPYFPTILRTSTSQEEGVERKWSISVEGFKGNEKGEVVAAYGREVKLTEKGFESVPGTEFEWPVDYVFISMGFVKPVRSGLLEELEKIGLELDSRGNVKAAFGTESGSFATTLDRVYACGDTRRGQSLIVWAISEGRKCAAEIHRKMLAKLSV